MTQPEINPMQLIPDDSNCSEPNDNIGKKDTVPEPKDLAPSHEELEDTTMLETNAQHSEHPLPVPFSVIDDWDTIMNYHFTKLDEEIIESQIYHWNISEWLKLPERVESPTFDVGSFRWSILLFPHGNNQKEYVSIYVKLADIEEDPEAYACAQFAIFLSSPSKPTNYQCQAAQHRFTQYASDWGFSNMFPIDRLQFDNHQSPLLENNCIRVSIVVQVVHDETGVLWHNFVNYDSKKTTGFVGLRNQGATCYMNSLFQSLYCTNYFRKAVYQIPTEQDSPTGSVALAIQRLFYNLQCRDTFVDTVELTKSFGWDSSDAFMQHDIQEFNRILQDTLETKMKNTPADGAIKKLFQGRMKSYIKCINIDYQSSRTEDYYDIQLNVKNCENLEASFIDYVAEEMMDGENKYHAEGHGLQDAKKGVIFESFPPVLHLQLKRFEYDVYRDNMVKINDRHEFPLEINLEPYLDLDVCREVSHKYILHGVLVHTGSLMGGHYFAFVKPTKEQKWLRFDDDRVVPATLREVLEDNYGGEPLNVPGYRGYKRSTNAYMLVYIRESMLDEILAGVSEKDIPTHLVKKFEQECQEREIQLKEEEEQHLYIFVQVITEEAFKLNNGIDFVSYDHLVDSTPTSIIPRLHVRRDMTFGDFKMLLSEKLGVSKDRFRIWSIVSRLNQTIRPDSQIDNAADENKSIDYIINKYQASQVVFRIFIEAIQPSSVEYSQTISKKDIILIFIKYFEPEVQCIRGVGFLYTNKMNKIKSKLNDIKAMIGLESRAEIDLYEEVKPTKIDKLDPEMTFDENDLQNGDIFCAQTRLSDEKRIKLMNDEKYPTIPEYFDFLFHRIDVIFVPYDDESTKQIRLSLGKNLPYTKVVKLVADKLGANPEKVQLLLPVSKPNVEPLPIRPAPSLLFQDILYQMIRLELLYQVHDISVAELETKRTLEITVCIPTLSDTNVIKVRVSKHGCVADFLQIVETQCAKFKSNGGTRQLRLFQTMNCKFHCEFFENDPISSISESSKAQLYAEEVPQEEIDVNEEDLIYLPVSHYQRDIQRTHSVPFQLLLIKDEEFRETKKRLQQRTGMSDKDWSKVNFNLLTGYKSMPIQDDHIKLWELNLVNQQESTLVLDHVDEVSRAMQSALNKPLTIRR